MANNLYVNQQGKTYSANAPGAPGDSQLTFPDPVALVVAPQSAGTATDANNLKALVKLNKQQNGKMPANYGWDA